MDREEMRLEAMTNDELVSEFGYRLLEEMRAPRWTNEAAERTEEARAAILARMTQQAAMAHSCEVEHADTKRLRYVYSGEHTESNALVDLELRLLNGERTTLEEARAAIDEAMAATLSRHGG